MFGKMPSAFQWESSDIDWCENNFKMTPLVAEFWNTVSIFSPEECSLCYQRELKCIHLSRPFILIVLSIL